MKHLHTIMLPIGIGLFALLWTPLAQQTSVAYGIVAAGIICLIVALMARAKNQEQQQQLMRQLLEETKKSSATVEAIAGLHDATNTVQSILTTQQEQMNSTFPQLIDHLKDTKEMTANIHQKVQQHHDDTTLVDKLALLDEKIAEANAARETFMLALINDTRALTEEVQNGVDDLRQTNVQLEKTVYDGIEDLRRASDDLRDTIETKVDEKVEADQNAIEKLEAAFNDVQEALHQTAQTFKDSMEAQGMALSAQATQLQPIMEATNMSTAQLQTFVADFETKLTAQLQQLTMASNQLKEVTTELADSKSTERKQLLNVQKKLLETYSI